MEHSNHAALPGLCGEVEIIFITENILQIPGTILAGINNAGQFASTFFLSPGNNLK